MDTQSLAFWPKPSLPIIVELLRGSDLPAEDLSAAHLEHFFACGSADAPLGIVGLEVFGSSALLRSLVVRKAGRSHGLGSALVKHIEDYARKQHVKTLYLLTTTAEVFFERLGY